MFAAFETFESRSLMSASPVLTTTQIDTLKTALAPLTQLGTSAKKVGADIAAAAKASANPASTSALKKLKADVKAAFADRKLSKDERALLVEDVKAVLASAGVTNQLTRQTGVNFASAINNPTMKAADLKSLVSNVTTALSTLKK